MSEETTPQTPFAVAYRLAEVIAFSEKKQLRTAGSIGPAAGADRAYVLDLYKECLEAVASQGPTFSSRG
jgi:hypothetical protein